MNFINEVYKNSETFGMSIVIKVDSFKVTNKYKGIFHFIEHMFSKIKLDNKKTNYQLVELNGGYIRAYTTPEYICIFGSIIAEKSEILIESVLSIFLLSKMDLIDYKTLQQEKDVIKNERNLKNKNLSVWSQNEIVKYAFNIDIHTNIIGNEKTLSNFNQKIVDSFLKELMSNQKTLGFYGPKNKDYYLNYIFEVLNKYDISLDTHKLKGKKNNSILYKPIYKVNKTTFNSLNILIPGTSYYKQENLFYMFLNTYLSKGFNSYFTKNFRSKHGYIYSVESSFETYSDFGFQHLSMFTENFDISERIMEMFVTDMNKLKINGISKEEFNAIKNIIKSYIVFNLENKMNSLIYRCRTNLLEIENDPYDFIENKFAVNNQCFNHFLNNFNCNEMSFYINCKEGSY